MAKRRLDAIAIATTQRPTTRTIHRTRRKPSPRDTQMKSKLAPLCLLLLGLVTTTSVVDASIPFNKPSSRSSSSSSAAAASRRLLIPSASLRRSSSSFSLGWNLHPLSIRGGELLESYDSDVDISTDDDDDDDEEEYDSEEESELSEDEMSNLEIDSDDDDDENGEMEEEPSSSSSSSSSSASGPPVKLSIRTALQSPLIDQHLEFAASRRRTVLSLKQAVGKTMRGRPPPSSIQIKHHGRTLDDDETIDDILEDIDEEEEEEEGDDDIGEDDEDTIKISLTCDIVPPIDAKFGIEFREKITKMSTKDILAAYCDNMAGMMYGQELQAKEGESYDKLSMMEDDDGGGDDDEDYEGEGRSPSAMAGSENHSLNIRKKAALIQKQFRSTLSDETLRLMEEEHERVEGASSENVETGGGGDAEKAIYGLTPQGGGTSARSGRKGRTLKGGATMNVKRALQRNLNVNWADTTRNSLLFLFFGYFGGRNSFSRTFLLLSSPLCFFIQTRPVKVAMKQLFYTIGEPPGIFLSLLPAPQQAIMSLDYGGVMRGLYGEKALAYGGSEDEWLEMEQLENDGDERSSLGEVELDSDEEYDQYDDESDYDSEEEY